MNEIEVEQPVDKEVDDLLATVPPLVDPDVVL